MNHCLRRTCKNVQMEDNHDPCWLQYRGFRGLDRVKMH